MKKILFLMAMCIALISCNDKKDEPIAQHQVKFNIPALQVETEPMNAPRRAPILTDDDGQQMTYLFAFDGDVLLLTQENTDPDFGTVVLMLTAGEHHLHFIASRSAGLEYNEGILNCTSLRPTYGSHYDIDVTGSSTNELTMSRLTGQIVLTLDDEIPNGATNLRIQFGDYYKGIDPTDFSAIRSGEFDQTISIATKTGTTGASWTINILVPIYGTEYETTYTITATNNSGAVVGQATGTMPLNSSTKTLLHGNLFAGTSSTFKFNTSWNADQNVSF